MLLILKYAAIAVLLMFQPNATFETDGLPGEGIPVYEASSNEILQLSKEPSASSPVAATVKVSRDQRVPYDGARTRTTQASRVNVLAPARIEGRLIGNVTRFSHEDEVSGKFRSVKIEVKPGTKVDYLQYGAEGTCFVRVDDSIIEAAPCPTIDTAAFRVLGEPVTEEWIHVVVGQSSGWLLITGSNLKLVNRDF